MPRPIVAAYHLIWTAYGYWLPNDPRGSTSRGVATDVIAQLGESHYGRRKLQPPPRVVDEFYARAEAVLKFPLLEFGSREVVPIGDALSEAIGEHRYTCYACAIMPDHVHLIVRRHKHKAEEMIDNLQEASRLRLSRSGLRQVDHPVWAEGGWKGFLDHPDAIRRTIRYIENNPLKAGLPRQHWPFVTEYNGWPLHPGHNPNSPYARRLRDYRQKHKR